MRPVPLGGLVAQEGGCAFEWFILLENNYLFNLSLLEAIERLIKNKPSEIAPQFLRLQAHMKIDKPPHML
jgi:hypothetical protein